MKRKLGFLLLMLCLLFSMTITANAESTSEEKVKNDIEIVLYNEKGEIVSWNEENAKIVSQLLEEISGEQMNAIMENRAACTHIPCNQYEGYLYGHAKISSTECWVYRMKAIICKCCGGAIRQLSGWEFQYSHTAHW